MCPFNCDLQPFRTMKLLLGHCMKIHHDSLGKWYRFKILKQLFLIIGMKMLAFNCFEQFLKWKELEEETTYTTYVQKQSSYKPKANKGTIITLKRFINFV